jgi:hypothetical protein
VKCRGQVYATSSDNTAFTSRTKREHRSRPAFGTNLLTREAFLIAVNIAKPSCDKERA